MKNLLYILLCCTLLLAGCNKDLAEHTPTGTPENNAALFLAPQHFYGTAYSDLVTKGVAQADKLWPTGSTITVKFLNDDFNMAAQVEEWAKEWEQYAIITFDFVDPSQQADVRIGFDWNDNRWITWSYIGTDCLSNTDQGDATISYAFWDTATPEEIKGDVLRTFGQVLGLELEHRHLDFDPGWVSEAQVRKFWTNDIEDIPWSDLQKYVYTPLEQAGTLQSENYDPASIMIWPFGAQYAANTQRYFNYELSETDKVFIATLYPEPPEEPIAVITGSNYRVSIAYTNTEDIVITYGNHRDTVLAAPNDLKYTHFNIQVPEEEFPEMRIYGSENALELLWATNFSALDVSGCLGLETVEIDAPLADRLDVSHNIHLKSLKIYSLPITELDLSQNVKLEYLGLITTQVEELDLMHNSKLKTVYLSDNRQLLTLDMTRLPLLEELTCYDLTALTQVDISKNPLLRKFLTYGCPFTELDFSNNRQLERLECRIPTLTRMDLSVCESLTDVAIMVTQIEELDLSGCVRLSTFACTDSPLKHIDFSHNPVLWWVSLSNTDMLSDREAMVAMAESLPDYSATGNNGSIDLYLNKTAWEWIADICLPKNWTKF